MTFIPYHRFGSAGAISDVAKLDVDSLGATSHTLTNGRQGICFQNVGSSICWFGGATVDPANSRGNILLPRAMVLFENVQKTFKIYFKCAAGETTTIGIVEIMP